MPIATVKVLIEGYAKKLENGFIASSTTCLITTKEHRIITDPGCNREKLLAAMKQAGLAFDDIHFVFLSHCHPDHILLAGLFEKAKFVTFDSNLLYEQDKLTQFDSNVLGDDIEILETPGHTIEHLSLIVQTEHGKVAIAGDTIWWLDDEQQIFDLMQKDHSQVKGMNMPDLIESRKKLISMADVIIPGHGKMFQVEKSAKTPSK